MVSPCSAYSKEKKPSGCSGRRASIGWSYPHDHGSGHKPSNAIRKGKWKLIRFDAGEKFELYDLSDRSRRTEESGPG